MKNQYRLYVVVTDDAFAMRNNVMKPYPGHMLSVHQRVHNYRLSRARRIVEIAFDILAARFRIFRSPIHLDANKTERVTLSCCALHNFLIDKTSSYVSPSMVDRYDDNGAFVPGGWKNHPMPNLKRLKALPRRIFHSERYPRRIRTILCICGR